MSDDDALAWCRNLQSRCGAYYHGSLKDPVQFPDREGARRGYEDALMEEAIILTKRAEYLKFLESKAVMAKDRGFTGELNLNPVLFPHQRDLSAWALRGGNRAVFAAFGLGKTLIQIQILQTILREVEGSGLVVCPLGIRGEFSRDAERFFGIRMQYVRTNDEHAGYTADGQRSFITNYERVRDGNLDPNRFQVVTLDESSVLRSFGSKTYQTFLQLFQEVPYKFVCTATPSPNRYKELIHYAAFLGIMDSGMALTRFFKRDSSTAGNLTLHPHKEKEFWLWVASWATFLTVPSDLGYSDEGYELPPLRVHLHRLPVDHSTAGFDSWGQGKLLRNASLGVSDQAREKRDSLQRRVEECCEIIKQADPDRHWIIWHDLEDERRAIEKALPEAVTVYGSQDLEEREQSIMDFSEGKYRILATKPIIAGSGCNFQRHCHSAIYLGVGYKFNDWIQSVHRLQRFLQTEPVEIHLIYTESEDHVYETLMRKWEQHKQLTGRMREIILQHGLNNARLSSENSRSITSGRRVVTGQQFTAVNQDNMLEMPNLADNSVDLIVTSWPFSNHYEYTETFNDFGHNEDDARFFEQMDFLTPETLRVLKPGRMYCLHCKDRLLYGSVTGLGMYSVNPFSDKCVAHLRQHGLIYCGRITIVTDVVRENNQTYRLGWTEKCKDGTKMGVGSPEYILLFRKLPTDTSRAYADTPVMKSKQQYTRSRWQFDASPFWRSNGDRFLTPDEIRRLPQEVLRQTWHAYNQTHVYDFQQHVGIAEALESQGLLPATFMLLDPTSHGPWVWPDIARMKTLNTEQSRRRLEMHICPLQLDVVERLIETYSSPGELVFDPFAGIMTVPYVAVKMGRKGYGIELSTDYWKDGVAYCQASEAKYTMPSLFDVLEAEHGSAPEPSLPLEDRCST